MAQKKPTSRAEKIVSDAKKKNPGGKPVSAAKAATGKKPQASGSKQAKSVKTEYESGASSTAITAFVSLGLFLLFFMISVNPEGALMQVLHAVLMGLIGKGAFYFAIPALLYLFIINTFGRKHAVKMRTICTVVFLFFCGCIFHLAVQNHGLSSGADVVIDLYLGGRDGITGGILCGGAALLLRWACGKFFAFVICIVAAIFTLLAALGITPVSMIRAIANRPRYEEEEEEEQDYIEPAVVVVNHIANKQIEHKRQKRQAQQAALAMQTVQSTAELPQSGANKAVKKAAAPAPAKGVQAPQPQQTEEQPVQSAPEATNATPSRGTNIMNTIGMDSTEPMAAAPKRKAKSSAAPAKPTIVEGELRDSNFRGMPKLEMDIAPPSFVMAKSEEPLNVPKEQPKPVPIPESRPEPPVPAAPKTESKPGKVTAKEAAESAQQIAAEIEKKQETGVPAYCFPPIDLLKRPMRSGADGTDEMRENSRRLNETLASFKIDAHIINVTRGPSVTRYEVELDKGVRLNKLTGCADDIALSLGASGVRIAAVPGKISVVGIEVPNRAVTTVSLREVIDSPEFAKAKSKSSFSVGKDIGGSCIVGNIAKMPHMLIAGTTGSGKSVCMNSIIISLLYKASPEDVKLIMVDTKMVELGIYNVIPHLLIPVVNDPKKAAGSLQWAVTEMLRRYKMMSDAGVRDLESYNSIVTAEEGGQKLPQVVIIIDELADLMMVAAKEVEDSICRIAQMGRASGMHLIIATQRPSADVITGLMKANIPSRIAFSVASAMESRIILDTMGAEKLVGKGDMLYAPIGCGKPLRVQGCFVTDSEVESVANYVKENYVADYNQQVLEEIEKKAASAGKKAAGSVSDPEPNAEELDGDEMLPAAVDVILETGQASVSMLQRRLKLGYARAARIVDEMEEKGIVGPFQGSKPRSILVTKEQWQAMKSGQPQQMDFDDLEPEFDGVPEELM